MRAVAAVFASVFLLYLGCLYPAIAPRDSADMATAAMTLGVAHPPGYPLYSLLGHAWLSVFPWANAAYRLNVLSAVAGAAAVTVLFVFLRRRAGTLAGVTAAALWALSAPLWKFSLLEEKYALHALFAVSLLALAEGDRKNVFARARISGLLLGLGLVNHQSLLFAIPGLAWLWREEAKRTDVSTPRLFTAVVPPLFSGLAMYAFLWVRLGALAPAMETVLRRQYGAGTLSTALAGALTPESAGTLFIYALRESARAVSWPAAAAGVIGAAWVWSQRRARVVGWMLVAAAGPVFVLLSRIDPDQWVARSVLEPAFLIPTLILAIFAGEAVGALRAQKPLQALAVAVLLPAASLVLRAPLPEHRDDFLAYDFVRDLRRAVPPGGALLSAGDTSSFGLHWLNLMAPGEPREIAAAKLIDSRDWISKHVGNADIFVNGMGPADLRKLGLPSTTTPLWPEGLVQRVGGRMTAPAPSVLRRPRSWTRDESYARDAKLSYAFASWLSARLLEAQGMQPTSSFDLFALAADPEDYHWR